MDAASAFPPASPAASHQAQALLLVCSVASWPMLQSLAPWDLFNSLIAGFPYSSKVMLSEKQMWLVPFSAFNPLVALHGLDWAVAM